MARLTPEQQKIKQRYIRYVIFGCLALIPIFGALQRSLLQGDITLPISSTVLIFALININGLLLLLMLYLVLRNLVELVFERNYKILGNKLRTRLVVSFVALSLVPTALLFFISISFMSTSMDYWFRSNVDDSLQSSLKLAQSILKSKESQAEEIGKRITNELRASWTEPWSADSLNKIFTHYLDSIPSDVLDALTLINSNQEILLSVNGLRLFTIDLPDIPTEALRHARENQETKIISQKILLGELVRAITPVKKSDAPELDYFLITTLLIPTEQLKRMQEVSQGITDYRQLVILKAPIKFSMLIILFIITLLIIFGAIWFGFYFARSLTGPINILAEATRKVADGQLDFVLEKGSDDEMGLLVASFNKMTSDLSAGKSKLEEAHKALQKSNFISEQRRRYMETVLKNVAAGVIAINENYEITAINRFAENLLKINPADFLNKKFHDVLRKPHIATLEGLIRELTDSEKQSIEHHLRLTVRKGETFSLHINITRLEDENDQPIGYVIVFHNLTKLEKAQRLAAWQEVARRIAHEIKNPLTPIQLSAQRLRKRYLPKFTDDSEILDQCTKTIVNQVDEIKRLVSEFSNFARMPKIAKKKGNLVAVAEDTIILYREAHKHITFNLVHKEPVPDFLFDPIQLKRVLINLLDNGVKELSEGGTIEIIFEVNHEENSVVMKVSDTGPGIDEKLKLRLFEPYFSTRKSGTGLGLAIANTIITEHNGSIYVTDNHPSGAVFVVELPINS